MISATWSLPSLRPKGGITHWACVCFCSTFRRSFPISWRAALTKSSKLLTKSSTTPRKWKSESLHLSSPALSWHVPLSFRSLTWHAQAFHLSPSAEQCFRRVKRKERKRKWSGGPCLCEQCAVVLIHFVDTASVFYCTVCLFSRRTVRLPLQASSVEDRGVGGWCCSSCFNTYKPIVRVALFCIVLCKLSLMCNWLCP